MDSNTPIETLTRLRIALVNDWLVHLRGQERVFEALCNTFPSADIFTLVYDKDRMPCLYRQRRVRTSFVQHLPYSRRGFRVYLPLYPLAAKSIDLTSYDVVIASSSAFIHGVRVGPQTVLTCYCHSPFRYAWSHYDSLISSQVGPVAKALAPIRSVFCRWDRRAANAVDCFIAPSQLVQRRIKSYYGRDSAIVPPPVDLDIFRPTLRRIEDYFLVVSPLMRWKHVEIVVQAFGRLGLPLKIVGDGEEGPRLRAMATRNVQFIGELAHGRSDDLVELYANCRAVIVPSAEDFGLVALEAMACGRPVIALRSGGALETVVDGRTGCFFAEQSPAALASAVVAARYDRLDPVEIRRYAERYSFPRFRRSIVTTVAEAVSQQVSLLSR